MLQNFTSLQTPRFNYLNAKKQRIYAVKTGGFPILFPSEFKILNKSAGLFRLSRDAQMKSRLNDRYNLLNNKNIFPITLFLLKNHPDWHKDCDVLNRNEKHDLLFHISSFVTAGCDVTVGRCTFWLFTPEGKRHFLRGKSHNIVDT